MAPAPPDWDSLIPIDPVLQQSQPAPTPPPPTPYSSYTAYNQQYQQQPAYHAYQQQQAAQQAQQQQHYAAPTPARQDSTNVATLNDAVGSAGVDLRAEEEKLRSTTTQSTASSSRVRLDRSRTQPLNPNFDIELLKPRLAEIAAHHKLAGGIPEDTANYVALALRTRLESIVRQMSVAARHRTDTQFDRPAAVYAESLPMWSLVVRSDVAKQAVMLERVEREEENRVRRERKERTDMTTAHAAALAAQSGGGGGGMDYDEEDGGKRKKKKDGPGVTARNMSEDVRKKMSNAVASQAAGLTSKYSWMTAGNAAAAAAKPVAAKTSTTTTTPSSTPALPSTGGWARAYVPPKKTDAPAPAPEPVEEDTRIEITIRDAQFVVEKERGHGGGRGSGKGWT
ncbi:transcription initiation factor TFIID component TAF4 family-domain-containing protein [Mycena filopes]|nr:transcription initiation factor TFIID component TAF4 family-domain-containing protein [Mycena filopes]